MRKEIEALIFSDVSSYDIYVNTGVNQGLIGDIKNGYLTIDCMPSLMLSVCITLLWNVNHSH